MDPQTPPRKIAYAQDASVSPSDAMGNSEPNTTYEHMAGVESVFSYDGNVDDDGDYDMEPDIKDEVDSDYEVSPKQPTSKRSTSKQTTSKSINKSGQLRKQRQPRAKLLKWTDGDWKMAVLALVAACGEAGINIPFDNAAKMIEPTCTASALQQAVLKLRQKMVDEGRTPPTVKMSWTKKNQMIDAAAVDGSGFKASTPMLTNANSDNQTIVIKYREKARKPTAVQEGQVLILTLKFPPEVLVAHFAALEARDFDSDPENDVLTMYEDFSDSEDAMNVDQKHHHQPALAAPVARPIGFAAATERFNAMMAGAQDLSSEGSHNMANTGQQNLSLGYGQGSYAGEPGSITVGDRTLAPAAPIFEGFGRAPRTPSPYESDEENENSGRFDDTPESIRVMRAFLASREFGTVLEVTDTWTEEEVEQMRAAGSPGFTIWEDEEDRQ
jgi:hypothetical protein